MNSLKKGERVPLLNFGGCPGVPPLNFKSIPGPYLNFEGVSGTGVLVSLLNHAATGIFLVI